MSGNDVVGYPFCKLGSNVVVSATPFGSVVRLTRPTVEMQVCRSQQSYFLFGVFRSSASYKAIKAHVSLIKNNLHKYLT